MSIRIGGHLLLDLASARWLSTCAIKPLSVDTWNKFSPKAQWDCLSALRGPDAVWISSQHTDTLKYHTTAVIRAKLRHVLRIGGMINQHNTHITWPLWKQPGDKDPYISSHFFAHINAAATWLNIPTNWRSIEDFGRIDQDYQFPPPQL